MIENLNYSGLWWLPSNDNQKVWGTLTFSSQDGASLILWDSLKEQDFREVTEAEIILGKAYNHKIITLYKSNCISIRNDELGYRKSQYEIKYILLDRHIQNPADVKFRKIRIQYSHIREWIGKRNVSLGFFSSKEGKEDWIVNYRKAAPSKIQIKDEYVVSLTAIPEIQQSFNTQQEKEAVIKEKIFLEVECLKIKTLDEYMKIKTWIQNFLTFALSKLIQIYSIEVELESSNGNFTQVDENPCKLYYESESNKIATEDRKIPLPEILFTYETISTKFESILNKWFETEGNLKAVLDLYFGVVYDPNLYSELKFLGLTQAIEAYHRAVMEERSPYKQKHKIENQQILDSCPQCYDLLRKKLNDSMSLKERLGELFDKYSEIAKAYFYLKDREQFLTKIRDTRNMLEHSSKKDEQYALKDDELYYAVLDLLRLLQFCILTQLDFSIDYIKERFALA